MKKATKKTRAPGAGRIPFEDTLCAARRVTLDEATVEFFRKLGDGKGVSAGIRKGAKQLAALVEA